MEYLVNDSKFTLSYQELRESYLNFCEMDDTAFLNNLKAALHLAVVICFLKETPTYICLSDKGIIHELVHELDIGRRNTTTLEEIRELFKRQLMLA